MRYGVLILGVALSLGACSKGNSQADQLDNAAAQSDPAAAAVLRNQADAIRDTGSDGNASAPDSAAQNALQIAGNAATENKEPSSLPANQPVDNQTGLTRK